MDKKVYIAGPMRGYYEFNFPAFYEAEEYLLTSEYGFKEIFNPARLDEGRGLVVTGLNGRMDEIPDFDMREAMRINCILICSCTHLYMLRGWENSSGARAEHALGVTLGLKFIYESFRE